MAGLSHRIDPKIITGSWHKHARLIALAISCKASESGKCYLDEDLLTMAASWGINVKPRRKSLKTQFEVALAKLQAIGFLLPQSSPGTFYPAPPPTKGYVLVPDALYRSGLKPEVILAIMSVRVRPAGKIDGEDVYYLNRTGGGHSKKSSLPSMVDFMPRPHGSANRGSRMAYEASLTAALIATGVFIIKQDNASRGRVSKVAMDLTQESLQRLAEHSPALFCDVRRCPADDVRRCPAEESDDVRRGPAEESGGVRRGPAECAPWPRTSPSVLSSVPDRFSSVPLENVIINNYPAHARDSEQSAQPTDVPKDSSQGTNHLKSKPEQPAVFKNPDNQTDVPNEYPAGTNPLPQKWSTSDLIQIAELGNLKLDLRRSLLRDLNRTFRRETIHPCDLAKATDPELWPAIRKRYLGVFMTGECRSRFIEQVYYEATHRSVIDERFRNPRKVFYHNWNKTTAFSKLELTGNRPLDIGETEKQIALLYLSRYRPDSCQLTAAGFFLELQLPPLTEELLEEFYPAWRELDATPEINLPELQAEYETLSRRELTYA